MKNITYSIGVYNEEKVIKRQIIKLIKYLNTNITDKQYEILIIDNGSIDGTYDIAKSIKDKHLRVIKIETKGYGAAQLTGIKKAKYNNILLTAIDLPFGFSDLVNFNKAHDEFDIIFGSKWHKDSIVNYPIKRRLGSYIFNKVVHVLFKVPVKDTQGSVFLKKNKIVPLLAHCNDKAGFFTTQIAIYATLYGLRITEVSVTLNNHNLRKSRYSVTKDGYKMFRSSLIERRKIDILKANEKKVN